MLLYFFLVDGLETPLIGIGIGPGTTLFRLIAGALVGRGSEIADNDAILAAADKIQDAHGGDSRKKVGEGERS